MTVAIRPLPARPSLPFDPATPGDERCRKLVAALPAPLPVVLAAGRLDCRPRFQEDGFDGLVERWRPPATVTPRHAAMAQRALDELEAGILAPADPNHLLGRILALLSHYPAREQPPEVEQMIAMDWVEDLGEFPSWAIDEAARRWRRSRKWRPSIAELRGLCEDACAEERRIADRLRSVASVGREAGAGDGDDLSRLRRLAGASLRRIP